MATQNFPTISNEFVDLVETMRKAQLSYDKLFNDRDAHPTQHQIRRAEQARKDAEQKVDVMLVSYRIEVRKFTAWSGEKRTDQQPGLYAASKDAETNA